MQPKGATRGTGRRKACGESLQFCKFLQFGNLAIWKMESQPKLATSYSQKKLTRHNLGIWGPDLRLGEFGSLRFYQSKLGDDSATNFLSPLIYFVPYLTLERRLNNSYKWLSGTVSYFFLFDLTFLQSFLHHFLLFKVVEKYD